MSSTGFAHYRDASSSSLTTGSGSSLASSTGGLHMNVPMTSLTPIPVMITSPDGSLRRESMQSGQTEMKPPIFYTHNEVIIPPSSPFSYNSRLSYSQNSNFVRKSLSILSQYLEKGIYTYRIILVPPVFGQRAFFELSARRFRESGGLRPRVGGYKRDVEEESRAEPGGEEDAQGAVQNHVRFEEERVQGRDKKIQLAVNHGSNPDQHSPEITLATAFRG